MRAEPTPGRSRTIKMPGVGSQCFRRMDTQVMFLSQADQKFDNYLQPEDLRRARQWRRGARAHAGSAL